MSREQIAEEISDVWLAASQRMDAEAPARALDVHADVVTYLESLCIQATGMAQTHLQPWLAIYEFGLHWLGLLHSHLDARAFGDGEGQKLLAASALLGSGCSHANGVRRLELAGLDTSARSVLRSMVETLQLCTLTLSFDDLADRYRAASEPGEVAAVWQEVLAEPALGERVAHIEAGLDLDATTLDYLRVTRQEIWAWSGDFARPGYAAATLTVRPPTVEQPGLYEPGALGRCSSLCVSTLDAAIKSIWYFANSGGRIILYDRNTSDDLESTSGAARVGAVAFNELVLLHWNDADDFLSMRSSIGSDGATLS